MFVHLASCCNAKGNEDKQRKGKRGRIERSKSSNLLEKLIKYEEDVLPACALHADRRFMDDSIVPFSNNQGGNDDPIIN